MQNKSFLGIDLGTTTIKIALIDEKNQILLTKDKAHNAHQNHCSINSNWNEQCPKKIVQTFLDLIVSIDLAQLNRIGISGQMHGIVLWKADTINSLEQCKCSKLITWMDGRCDVEFLEKLPKWIVKNGQTNIQTEKSISSGYGMATLAWLKENCALDSEEWDRAGTIMDFLAAYLTQSNGTILMSDQNAESWGYKDVDNKWTILDHPNEFPLNLLPKIVKVGTIIGHSKIASAGIPLEVPILVPIGDLGASLLPILHKGEAALHIGTSAQLAFFLESNQPFLSSPLPPSIVQVPFFDGNSLLVAASLNGGNALDFFLQQIVKWSHQICGQPNKSEEIHYSAILDRIFQQQSNNFASSLSIKPTFFGERHNPQGGAIVEGWRAENSLEDFICSIARGIVQNLAEMMPEAFLSAHKITRLKLIGKAAGQKIFEEEAKCHFPNLLILNGKEELVSAAFGSALYAKRSLDK